LVEEGGFVYDSDAYNDELPYWLKVSGKPLIVPYSLTTNDVKFVRGGVTTGREVLDLSACGLRPSAARGRYGP
jgi:hypothetical protein